MNTPKRLYRVEGIDLTLDQIRSELQHRFPATYAKINDRLIQKRLGKTSRWDRLGECPDAAQRRTRDKFRTLPSKIRTP